MSPRFNLYFDFLTRRNIAVYAINYPGSTGLGNSYALSGKSVQESIQVQLPAIERDIAQLRRLHPESRRYAGRNILRRLPGPSACRASIPRSPVSWTFPEWLTLNLITSVGSSNRFYSPMLVIYGNKRFYAAKSGQEELIARYQEHASVSRLVLAQRGTFHSTPGRYRSDPSAAGGLPDAIAAPKDNRAGPGPTVLESSLPVFEGARKKIFASSRYFF